MTEAMQTQQDGFLQMVERLAASPEIDAEKVRAFLDMQMIVLRRNAEMAFNAAFSELQSELPELDERGKIVVNGVIRSTYTKFEDMNQVLKPLLKKHGFALMFKLSSTKGETTITGILTHAEGHREEASLTLEADTSGSKNGVQSIGSSTQYGKRYVMAALLNLTTRGDDDDGRKAGTQVIDEKQVADLRALAEETKSSIPKLLKFYKIDKIENLPASLYASAVSAFRKHGKETATA